MANPIQTSGRKSSSDVQNALEFFMWVGKLKQVKRTGWVHHQVKHPESVAEHMYRMAVMTMLLDGNHGIDKTRCLKLAVVHDLAECIVGDLTPYCGVDKEEKSRREKEAMLQLTGLLHKPEVADEVMTLWMEYHDQLTAESQAVKDLDRFEMILQAFEYELGEKRFGDLQSFFDGTVGTFRHPAIQRWVQGLNEEREKHLDGKRSESSMPDAMN